MKYLVTDTLNNNERIVHEMEGLFCYDLRDSDFGNAIATIEKRVFVNNIGSILTDEEINMRNYDFVDYNDFCMKNEQVFKMEDLIPKGEQKRHNQKINMDHIQIVNPGNALLTKMGILKGYPQKAYENAIKNGMKNPENWKYLYTINKRDFFKNVKTKEYISFSRKKEKNKER